jgi:hypothetical protein
MQQAPTERRPPEAHAIAGERGDDGISGREADDRYAPPRVRPPALPQARP